MNLFWTLPQKLQYAFQQVSKFLIPYMTLLVCCLCMMLFYSKESLFFAINACHFLVADAFFSWITHVGDKLLVIFLTSFLLLFNYSKGFLMGSTFILTALVTQGLKQLFNAPRPKIYFANKLEAIYFLPTAQLNTLSSFPSGHTVTIFSVAVMLTYFAKNKSWSWLYLLTAVTVAFSRVYLGLHFFEDIVVGSMIGVFVTVCWLAYVAQKDFLQSKHWRQGLIAKRPRVILMWVSFVGRLKKITPFMSAQFLYKCK